MKYSRQLIAMLFLTMFLLAASLTVPLAFAQALQGKTFSIEITNAFPADLEGDGAINDVVVIGTISCEPQSSIRIRFILIPPRGRIIVTDSYTIHCGSAQEVYEIHLYNVAKLPGYYKIIAFAFWNHKKAVSNVFVFDPGGGGPGPPG